MRCLVLAYHSHNIAGTGYGENDHVALASDLETVTRLGARIVPLGRIAQAVASGAAAGDVNGAQTQVAITFDDGPVFDFEDFVHRRFGPQRGFLGILRDFLERHGASAQSGLHATSFVIASAEARAAMERAPDCGYPEIAGWLRDDWWKGAVESGLMAIGNHSWDHVHHAPANLCIAAAARDDFTVVDNRGDADREIRDAGEYIAQRAGRACGHFAFPFGHVNDYLVREYLPRFGPGLGLQAAFGTGGRPVASDDSVWNIPRAVCGEHWNDSAGLAAILESAGEAR